MNTFKRGDKFLITKDGYHHYPMGTEVSVIEDGLSEGGNVRCCDTKKVTDTQFVPPNHLEPILPKVGETVTFTIHPATGEQTFTGVIYEGGNGFYLSLSGEYNSRPFIELGLEDYHKSINPNGAWPYCKSIEHLMEVVSYLENYRTIPNSQPKEDIPNPGDLIQVSNAGERYVKRILVSICKDGVLVVRNESETLFREGRVYETTTYKLWKPDTKPNLPKVGPYDGVLEGTGVKYGCQIFTREDIENMSKLPKTVRFQVENQLFGHKEVLQVLEILKG